MLHGVLMDLVLITGFVMLRVPATDAGVERHDHLPRLLFLSPKELSTKFGCGEIAPVSYEDLIFQTGFQYLRLNLPFKLSPIGESVPALKYPEVRTAAGGRAVCERGGRVAGNKATEGAICHAARQRGRIQGGGLSR